MPKVTKPIVRGPATTSKGADKKKKKPYKPSYWLAGMIPWLDKANESFYKSTSKANKAINKAIGNQSTPARYEQYSLLTPQQEMLQNILMGSSAGLLQKQLGNQFDFAPIEEEARHKFQTETVPGLAERFTAMGGEGGQRSGRFQHALGQSAKDLERGLAALKSQYNLQQGEQQQSLLQSLLHPALANRYESLYHQRQPGFMESFLPQAVGQAVKQGIRYGGAAAMGGPTGMGTVAATDIARAASKLGR